MFTQKNIALLILFLFFIINKNQSQVTEPKHIKTVQITSNSESSNTIFIPIRKSFTLSFDDLEADQKEYYYKIELMTHDWKPSKLQSNQYIIGFNSNVILNVENSFNTFQNYSHYSINFPNRNTRITKSGNYKISILNSYDDVIFTRRITLYEEVTPVGVRVTRSRNTKTLDTQQTVNFTVNYSTLNINNPQQEIHVVVMQNQNWETAITNLQPTFFKKNQLVYNQILKSNFWGGNEYLFFDNKTIQNTSLNIIRTERKDVYYNYIYPYENTVVKNYTYNPDINGQFVIRTLNGENPNTEADYAMMDFTITNSKKLLNKDVYVYGAFNNFGLTNENKMIFNDNNNYHTEILLKQGFYNYTFVTVDENGFVSQSNFRGDFSRTENEYTVIVYYKPFGGLYDRAIGISRINYVGER